MVPPLSTKDQPRRSARRPLHTPASSTSLSPSSANNFPAPTDPPSPPTPSSNLPPHHNSKRAASNGKRVKQEPDDLVSAHSARHPMDDTPVPATNGRAKRKPKDSKVELVVPAKQVPDPPTHDISTPDPADDNDDDGGITRCVCGRTDLDADEEDGLMVMCETCKVWQHAVCVNLQEDLSEQDYYCEQCRPDLHVELLKSLKKQRARQQVGHGRRASASVPRSSRSHSPGHMLSVAVSKTAPKRRNTMNSRDADYEESVKQLIESTRPDAERNPDSMDKEDIAQYEEAGIIIEIVSGARKKRKRLADKANAERDESSIPNKRQRSNSTTPDQPVASTVSTKEPPTNGTTTNGASNDSRHASTSSGTGAKQSNAGAGTSKKRGRKEPPPPEMLDSKKHPNQYTYRKPIAPTPPKRSGVNGSNGSNNPPSSSNAHEHGTRRNAHTPHTPSGPQPLLTSWGLPDYLAHLASELPTDVPRPVEVRVIDAAPTESGANDTAVNGSTTEDHTVSVAERGVKPKWPAKRTSVSDMNKRVRGIIDWVGREQAMAFDRRRRREALRLALKAQAEQQRQQQQQPDEQDGVNLNPINPLLLEPLPESEATHLMEELMKELIGFQEKYGPGAGKGKERKAAG